MYLVSKFVLSLIYSLVTYKINKYKNTNSFVSYLVDRQIKNKKLNYE